MDSFTDEEPSCFKCGFDLGHTYYRVSEMDGDSHTISLERQFCLHCMVPIDMY